MAYPLLIAPEAPPSLSPEEVELRCLELESVLAEAAGADSFEDLADFAILDLRGEGGLAKTEQLQLVFRQLPSLQRAFDPLATPGYVEAVSH
ncbi:hypothetical protein AK812_SmicGene1652 [Symbiodinium microadriaticum]|uniref:Uncharacterized protein n=1 Tax=Symbiodinium microadriaticum TaxID=2951 RepID=A0A1Q9F3E3_SYMMI|nr:hypothetical protein AK812_SmicGene1652 [Symbiodinium microadriaticum]